MHIGRFFEWRTASWDGVSTWQIIFETEKLSDKSIHHHTHRMLSLSVGVPRLVVCVNVHGPRSHEKRQAAFVLLWCRIEFPSKNKSNISSK